MAKDLFSLPPPARLKRMQELAAEAEAFGDTLALPELRNSYRKIARSWREMAAQLEKSILTAHAGTPERQKPSD